MKNYKATLKDTIGTFDTDTVIANNKEEARNLINKIYGTHQKIEVLNIFETI